MAIHLRMIFYSYHLESAEQLSLYLFSPLGSVYETFGHENCLSTGDVIKVVDLKVKKLLASNSECEDDSLCSSATVELPLNFPGIV